MRESRCALVDRYGFVLSSYAAFVRELVRAYCAGRFIRGQSVRSEVLRWAGAALGAVPVDTPPRLAVEHVRTIRRLHGSGRTRLRRHLANPGRTAGRIKLRVRNAAQP